MQFTLVYALWFPFRHIVIPVINRLPSGVVNNTVVAIFKEQAVIMTVNDTFVFQKCATNHMTVKKTELTSASPILIFFKFSNAQ